MKMKTGKIMVLLGIVSALNIGMTGCGTTHEYNMKIQENEMLPEKAGDAVPEDKEEDTARAQENTVKAQENAVGRWQVLEPEAAAAFDADFKGKVWKITEDSFYIVETKVKILEDGSLSTSTPSSNAPIPDSWLIQVVFDDDTTFLVRTIYDNGESYEDQEAGFEDLEEHMAVDMKGHFEEDVFYATEIRMPEIGDIGDARKETWADSIIEIVEK